MVHTGKNLIMKMDALPENEGKVVDCKLVCTNCGDEVPPGLYDAFVSLTSEPGLVGGPSKVSYMTVQISKKLISWKCSCGQATIWCGRRPKEDLGWYMARLRNFHKSRSEDSFVLAGEEG